MRWLERLPASSPARCRALFNAHSEFSDVTPTQYETAYAWLRSTGLLEGLYSSVPARHRVFTAAVASSGTQWFPDADVLVRGPDELPDDSLRATRSLRLTEDDAYAQVVAAWGKVDTAERERIGAAGELALVALLEGSVHARVEHVAAVADGYGYDIAVHAGPHSAHFEVKSTVRRGRLTVYLSRNEYETLRRDPAWQLVAIQLTAGLEAAAVASVPAEWIAAHVPTDLGSKGRWESCRLEVPADVPVPGIPTLAPLLAVDASELLTGAAVWPG